MIDRVIRRHNLALAALLGIFFVLYLFTLDTGLQPYELHGGDLITHQYAQVQARPSNAPGYPLYTMGGWLWFHTFHFLAARIVPLPNPTPILSSYSTLWALVALGLLYRLVCLTTQNARQPEGNWPVALLLTAFYGLTYFFWYYATTTEQYTSAIAQTLAIVYVYIRWQRAPNRDGLLILLAFLTGVSLAHMLTVALIVPPLVAVIIWQQPSVLRRPRLVAAVVFAALVPLISYAYVYVRGASHPEWWGAGDWTSAPQWFWSFVSTAQGREELGWSFAPGSPLFANGFPELIWQELSLVCVVIGLAGIARLDRYLRALLYATLALYLIFSWSYRLGNWFQVILPAYPLILLGVAQAAGYVQEVAAQRGLRRLLWAAPLLALLLAIGWRAYASWPAADSRFRPEDTALHRAAALLLEPLPSGAGLFAAVDDALALSYLTDIWGIRRDVTIVSSDRAAADLDRDAPLLATWDAVPTLLSELPHPPSRLQSFGPEWVRLESTDTPPSEPPQHSWPQPHVRQEREVLPGVVLAGYSLSPSATTAPVSHMPDPGLDAVLYWQLADGTWPDATSISVRPYSSAGYLKDRAGGIVQQDRPRPVHGLWQPPQSGRPALVADGYRLSLPDTSLDAVDGVTVVLYTESDGSFVNLAEFSLPLIRDDADQPAPHQ
jgi:hypothetical protein